MNGKKAKLIRKIARDMAIETTTQQETQYDAKRNSRKVRGGTIVVSHCERSIANGLKKTMKSAPNLPLAVFDDQALTATY